MKPVIVVGHAALDRLYRIEAFPAKPTKLRALDHREEGGGAASNAAAAIAMLGGTARLWSRVGDDETGEKVRRALDRCGVDTAFVVTCSGAITPTAAIVVDVKGERLVISEDDRVMPMEAGWLPVDQVASAGAVLSDLSWLEGTQAAFAEARRCLVDRRGDAKIRLILRGVGGRTHGDECQGGAGRQGGVPGKLPGQQLRLALHRVKRRCVVDKRGH